MSPNGIGFAGVLFIVFLVLKLCGVIAWSWWWVFAPLWFPLALVTVFVFVGLILTAAVDFMEHRNGRG